MQMTNTLNRKLCSPPDFNMLNVLWLVWLMFSTNNKTKSVFSTLFNTFYHAQRHSVINNNRLLLLK